jgi:lysophospholipase L1-like esterase
MASAACGQSERLGDDAAHTDEAIDANLAGAHFIGRFDTMRRFAWPGSQIRTRFAGTTISVDLTDSGENVFDVTIDGATTTIHPRAGRSVIVLANQLADGLHELVLTRRTESLWGTTTFHGFIGSPLLEADRPARLIEFIGDSITCGYGVLGADPTCSFTAATEAETRAWAAFTAAAVDAAHVSIAYSGAGVFRNFDGATENTLPARYGRTLADDETSTWAFSYTPDAIVINLGTNDFAQSDPGTPYVNAYASFVGVLRSMFPSAAILLATSPMLAGSAHATQRAYLDQVAAMAADPKLAVVEIAQQRASDGYGCDYHPNEVTQQRMATQLVPVLRAATGW